jgi:hypothetical protein
MNGAAVKIIIGPCSWWRLKRSPTVPPATERKALPAKPSQNRAISIVWIFWATADGMSQIRKREKETIYIGRRP